MHSSTLPSSNPTSSVQTWTPSPPHRPLLPPLYKVRVHPILDLSTNNPGQISTTLTSFSRTIDDYADTTKKELNSTKAEKATDRIATFRSELRDYRQRYADLKKDRDEQLTAHNRSELLGRRPHAATHTPENPYAQATNSAQSVFAPPSGDHGSSGLSFGAGPQSATRETHALREQNFFQQGNAQLDEYIARGREVLGNLGEQKDMLKNTQRKLYSVANTLGVSGDTIRMVERRAKQDKWIFWGGVVVFFGFCWLVLHYLR